MFYDRLKEACKNANTTVTAVLKAIGIGTANGTYWKNGSVPSSDVVIKLAEFLDVSIDYLLTGQASAPSLTDTEKSLITLFKTLSEIDKNRVLERAETLAEIAAQKAAEEAAISTKKSLIASDEEHNSIVISVFDLPASAGTGVFLSDSNAEPLDVFASPEAEHANFALRVSGSSMSPTFRNKDIVLVESAKDINIGEIGIFIADGEGYIKERGENALISHNHAYDPLLFSDFEYVKCIGRVLGKAKLVNSR